MSIRFVSLLIATLATSALPLTQNGGTWPSGHVQGIAVDVDGGYIYYSFTDMLAKYDFSGKLVGTLVGWTGHLGDLDFADGKVYGSLEYGKDNAFYIAVIDAKRIDRVGVEAKDVWRTVYLPEVAKDYIAKRYGCSGIDGVSFGPAFGHVDGPRYLTVAYGIYSDTERDDNDDQVLLQYDIGNWTLHGKYFVRTGNTTYGVQNLSYDESLQRWFMGVYQGKKKSFPNYLLFAVDARTPPRGQRLELANDGLKDAATGIRGWNQKADVGFQPVGHGLFYLSVNSGSKGAQTADLTLMRWTGDVNKPFEAAR